MIFASWTHVGTHCVSLHMAMVLSHNHVVSLYLALWNHKPRHYENNQKLLVTCSWTQDNLQERTGKGGALLITAAPGKVEGQPRTRKADFKGTQGDGLGPQTHQDLQS